MNADSISAITVIATAKAHVHHAQMRSSADLCIEDAVTCFNRGDMKHAIARAKKSLLYSVGIFSPIYQSI